MSCWKKLDDWPKYLKKMSVEELRKERRLWKSRLAWLGHPQAKQETENRIRAIEEELHLRQEIARK